MLQQYRDYLRTRNRTRKPLKQKEAGFLPTIKVRMSKDDVNVYKQETSLYQTDGKLYAKQTGSRTIRQVGLLVG